MIISLTNVISSLRRGFSIVRKNLQLFLDFEKSELVGGELVVQDKSPNTNNAKLFTGKALSFDGANDNINVSSFSMSGDIATFVFTMNSNNTSGRMFDANPTRFIISFDSNQLSIYTGAWHNFGSISTDEFHRVVITINGTTAKCFVDGVQLGTDKTITAIDLSNVTTASIGSKHDAASPFFYGEISDIQIWNAAWTQADVTFDYNNPQHLATDNTASSLALSNLKGYWHLSEGAGSIAFDSSGQGNNGTINGATWLTAQPTIAQLGLMDWAKSTVGSDEITLISNPNNPSQDILGNAVRLREHGFNLDSFSWAEIADDDTLDFSGEFTLEVWVKADFENVGSIFNAIYSINGSIAAATGLGFYTDTSKVYYRIGGATNTFTYTQDKWYYLAITRDSSNNFKFYKGDDGVISVVASGNNTVDFTSTESKFVGKDATNDFSREYPNLVDEPRAYNRGVSLDEIKQNYKAGLNKHKTGSSFSDDFSSDYGL